MKLYFPFKVLFLKLLILLCVSLSWSKIVVTDPENVSRNISRISVGNSYEVVIRPYGEVSFSLMNYTIRERSVLFIKSLESPIVLKYQSSKIMSTKIFNPSPDRFIDLMNPTGEDVHCEIVYEQIQVISDKSDTVLPLRNQYMFLKPEKEVYLTDLFVSSELSNYRSSDITTVLNLDVFQYSSDEPLISPISSSQNDWNESEEDEVKIAVTGIPQKQKMWCILEFSFAKRVVGRRSLHDDVERLYSVYYKPKNEDDEWLKFSLGVISFCLAVIILLNSVCLFVVCICCFLIPRCIFHMKRIQRAREAFYAGARDDVQRWRLARAWEEFVMNQGQQDGEAGQDGPVLQEPDEDEYIKRRLMVPEEEICVVCLDMRKVVTFRPCNHECCCLRCSDLLRADSNLCPVCRATVESTEVKEDVIIEDIEKLKILNQVFDDNNNLSQTVTSLTMESNESERITSNIESNEVISENVEENDNENARLINELDNSSNGENDEIELNEL